MFWHEGKVCERPGFAAVGKSRRSASVSAERPVEMGPLNTDGRDEAPLPSAKEGQRKLLGRIQQNGAVVKCVYCWSMWLSP